MNKGTYGNSGWIKLHRGLLDHSRFTDPEWLAVWVYILLTATHRPYRVNFDGQTVVLQPGQLVTGRHAIARGTGVNESKVKRVLAMMKAEGQIHQTPGVRGSIITVCNWKRYQVRNSPTHRRATSNRSANPAKVTSELTRQHRRKREVRPDQFTDSPETSAKCLTNDESLPPQKVTTNKKTRKEKIGHTHSARRAPSLRVVKVEAVGIGMSEGEVERFFHHFNARGWVDRHGNPITDWRSLLRTWKPGGGGVRKAAAQKADSTPGKKSPSVWELKNGLDAAEVELKQLGKSRPSIYASSEQREEWRRTRDGQRYVEMKNRCEELRAKLATAV